MIRLLLSILFMAFTVIETHASSSDTLLESLDHVIGYRSQYISKKQEELNALNKAVKSSSDDEALYSALGKIGDAYKTFDIDSTLYFSKRKLAVAKRIGKPYYIDDARMNMAEAMGIIGMYKEALELMAQVDTRHLKVWQIPYYYHVYKRIFDLLCDTSYYPTSKKYYSRLASQYRDSLLTILPDSDFVHFILLTDKYNVTGQYNKTIQVIRSIYPIFKGDLHNTALMEYTYAQAYLGLGNIEKQKQHLTLSAICDMKTGVREYASLRKLAVILYKEGDVNRAYNYLTLCMDDAFACKSRWRIFEVQQMFPIINEAYHQKLNHQRHVIILTLVLISVLSIFLLLALLHIRRQMHKVSKSRLEVQEANRQLRAINQALAENSLIKEEYIGHYISMCSIYIGKIEKYRKHLFNIATKKNINDVVDELRSTQIIEDELAGFYVNFDENFLKLFPNFVEEFNKLLVPEGQIHLKIDEKLNTELRIFALIRLGITNSQKIANFLRYSVTTIYNYRVKMRNLSAVKRDDFEDDVKKIGQVSEQ